MHGWGLKQEHHKEPCGHGSNDIAQAQVDHVGLAEIDLVLRQRVDESNEREMDQVAGVGDFGQGGPGIPG